MNNLQYGVINIIYSAITGEKALIPEDFSLSEGIKIAKKHKVEVMFYYGALNCGFEKDDPLMQELFMLTCQNIAISEQQMYSIKMLFSAFDEQSIEYMPLKGTILKNLYPNPSMRTMGDADILIKTKQYDKIKPIMQELGYQEVTESNHELIWSKRGQLIELHKRLIPSYNKDYYAYFGDGWRIADIKDGTRYLMTDEHQMIYLFTHFAKHYRDAGIGLRHMTDLWIYLKSNPNLDQKYIKQQLTILQLNDFYVNILDTLSVWFEGKKTNQITDFITEVIFSSGVYGKQGNHILSNGLRLSKSGNNVKLRKYFELMFLSYDSMCILYPILKKHPGLLPFMWVYRLCNALLFKRNKIKRNKNEIDQMNGDAIKNYQDSLTFVGLDFNFKE